MAEPFHDVARRVSRSEDDYRKWAEIQAFRGTAQRSSSTSLMTPLCAAEAVSAE